MIIRGEITVVCIFFSVKHISVGPAKYFYALAIYGKAADTDQKNYQYPHNKRFKIIVSWQPIIGLRGCKGARNDNSKSKYNK